MSTYNIGVIPGDGIGKEVIPEGIKILEFISAYYDISFNWERFDWSCEHYAKTGKMFNVDPATARRAILGITWSHLK